MLAGQETERVETDQRFHPADPGADGRLGQQLDQADVGRVGHVSATAELLGVVADGDYSHRVTVLLAEHRDRTVAAAA